MIEDVHRTWILEGASLKSKGMLGIYMIDNGSELFNSSTFQSSMKTFCDKNDIEFQADSFEDVNRNMLNDVQLKLEPKQFALLLVLDPILDLGGMIDD